MAVCCNGSPSGISFYFSTPGKRVQHGKRSRDRQAAVVLTPLVESEAPKPRQRIFCFQQVAARLGTPISRSAEVLEWLTTGADLEIGGPREN
jgi:hypothetical protein